MHRILSLLPFCLLGTSVRAASQLPTPDNYYGFLPAPPSMVAQTGATVHFRLYGDPGDPAYVDAEPRDGVDDLRSRRLLELAERFSPILRRNTHSVPEEFEAVLGDRVGLQVDSWSEGARVGSATIDLGPPRVQGATQEGAGAVPSPVVAPDDSSLLAVLRAKRPRQPHHRVVEPGPKLDTILYIDVPGEDEFGWRAAHGRDRPKHSRIYAHPFIHEVPGTRDADRYEFLLQYWFYYPYNDGANNHEGDWEHVTVSVTTAERARDPSTPLAERGLLTAGDVEGILGASTAIPVDSLVIRTVAYYFHNNVMVLPYLRIAAGGTMWKRAAINDGSIHIWEDTKYMDLAVRRRLELAGGRLATHPIGYIGGNNKGMDEMMQVVPRLLRSYNRDSHGTYPFPGVWRQVGPVDATEKIHGDVVPTLHRNDRGEPDLARPWFDLISDERYLTYRAKDIILLPDWERLERLVLEDAGARRAWAWLILPVHMGFPATRSPGAGALKHVDLGNVAPMSPPYNTAWNRPGATSVYPLYEPTVLRVAAAPISPAASLQSGWGVMNIPIAIAGLMPGFNVAITQLLPWITGAMHFLGAPPAKTFYLGELPSRFTSAGAGGFRQFGGKDFARLLPGSDHPTVRSFLSDHAPDGAAIGVRRRTPEWGSRAWFNLHYGSRLTLENSFAYSAARVWYPIEGTGRRRLAEVSGELYTRELTGGLTYRLPPTPNEAIRLYSRAGYAWTSSSLGSVTLNGQPFADADVKVGYLPDLLPSRSWWPNTTYAGVGMELFSPPKYWLFKRLGYGVRIEATGLAHRLNAPWECKECHVTAERGDVAMTLIFGW